MPHMWWVEGSSEEAQSEARGVWHVAIVSAEGTLLPAENKFSKFPLAKALGLCYCLKSPRHGVPFMPDLCARCHGSHGNKPYEHTVEHCIMNDSIGLYLNDIGKVALLTAEDEREL
jgi:hypothetical protein